jgi:hypothetical protein
VEALVEPRRAPARRGLRRCALGGVRRRVRAHAWALGVLLGSLGVALGLSCAGPLPDTCDELGTCGPGDAGPFDAGDGRGANAMTDGAADVAMDGCDPTKDPKDEPCVLDNAYGVFVASPVGVDGGTDAGEGGLGSGSGDGSMSQPYSTIAQALASLGNKTRVYLCNGLYGEPVSVTTAVSMYGGLSCAAGSAGPVWTYVGGSAQVSSPSPAVALSVTGVSSGVVTVEDVSFAAPDATAPGTSSIAALIAFSSVHLVRVTLSAGSGANGAAGAAGSMNPNYAGLAPAGKAQVWTTVNGLFGPVSGGAGGVNDCKQLGSSVGGNGGLGCVGSVGTAGTSNPQAPVTTPGRDGLAMGPVDGGPAIAANDPGADGVPGDGGVAAPAQIYGTLSPSGWVPSAGGDGTPGNPGQGGAGATDPLLNQCTVATQDIGGGGGGSGGCGGAGGAGGGGGGASIALASVGSTIDLTGGTLLAAAAGTGGQGGAGEDGQAGAPGGDDSSFSGLHAAGGGGGNGAGGSGGAGGIGGISAGIVESGSRITADPTTNTKPGSPGAGGTAGPGGRYSPGILMTGMDGHPGASGSAGTAVAVLSLM